MTNLIQDAKTVIKRWEKGDLAGAVRQLSTAIDSLPVLPKDFKNYDAFEVHPCTYDPEDQSYEQCEEDTLNIFCWTLYGHIRYKTATHPEGGVEDIVDFPAFARDNAFFVRDVLNAMYENIKYTQSPMSQYDRLCAAEDAKRAKAKKK